MSLTISHGSILRVLMTAAVAYLATALLTWAMIPFLKRIKAGQSIREDGPESHLRKSGTPTMGGVAIVLGVGIGFFALHALTADILVMFLTFAAYAALGFFDDFVKIMMKRNLGLTAPQKFALQVCIAAGIAIYQFRSPGNTTEVFVPFLNENVDFGSFYIPFVIFVIVAMVNSVNLTDGLDGLAAGITAMVALCMSFAGGLFSDSAFFSAALCGACLGFLLFNRHPAKIFMGDTGSLALGGGLAAVSVILHLELILPLVGFLYVLEALSVIVQVASYKLRGKRVFRMAPLHHHFELCGWSERKVVLSFWGATALAALCAVAASYLF
ncbi:MAG: phospho-N-acetylmuramoyl-pentapeptide-transferase [Clostridiales Family XIII bacterium]|jgi:phospho-N-acetylmuramoyl-pentapeptide-transferase|nr:phospho-N-acetylmuramoyl-pentapeptide-transferase [Clostridiales Family XIII bacterium]